MSAEGPHGNGSAPHRRRPLLGGGERLAHDAQPVRGPQNKYHPQSLEDVRRELGPVAREMRAEARTLSPQLRGERIVIEATLLPNYLAASHHPAGLRAAVDLIPVGTRNARGTLRTERKEVREQPTKTLLLAATERSFEQLETLLTQDVAADDKALADLIKLQDLGLPDFRRIRDVRDDEVVDLDEVVTWEAVLHPAVDGSGRLSDRVSELVMGRWRALVETLDGEVHEGFVRPVGNLTFMPVSLSRRALPRIAAFNPLRVLRPMARMRSIASSRLRGVDLGPLTPQRPLDRTRPEHRIAVFDGGAAAHPLLDPYVAHGDLTPVPRAATDEEHGTLVTSALLYGHIAVGRPLDAPPAQVDHFRVLPRPPHVSHDDEAYWVMDQIVERIESDNRWQIVNLSYGPDEPVDEDSEPNRFTAEIDRLAFENDVTFLVAAGNLREEERGSRSPLGLDRVKAPADAVNAIGVGACSAPEPADAVRSDYSCWGPGRSGLRVAPLGVAFGGDPNAQQFLGAAPGGGFQADHGTSYATPLAARGLATLLDELPEKHRHVNVLRGFAAHYAVSPKDADLDSIGYGRLAADYRPFLDCPGGTVTVLVSDTLERGRTQAYPLPFLPDGMEGMVDLRWTVSFVTPVDPEDAAEYSLAGVEVSLRPDSNRYRLEPPNKAAGKARDVHIVSDGKLIADRIKAGWRLSNNAKTRTGTARRSEHVRRDAGLWESVMRYETSARATSLHRPEVWLTYYERSQGQLVQRTDATTLDVAVLMTVSAPRVPDLYERVLAEADFRVLSPIVATVPVRVPV